MSQQKQNILIIETKDGIKYEGVYVSKDIQKQILKLANVKKKYQDKEEILPEIEISKENIANIYVVDIRPPKDDIHNINEIPENKKNAVDENKLANIEKAYDKSRDDFFDNLKPMTNPEAKKESRDYNRKNKDTFNMSEEENNNYNRGWRGRGNKRGYNRGRGRGGYGGGNHNYYGNGQHNNGYYAHYNKEDGNQNYHKKNNYRGRGFRGRGYRGGFQNNYQNKAENNNMNNKNE